MAAGDGAQVRLLCIHLGALAVPALLGAITPPHSGGPCVAANALQQAPRSGDHCDLIFEGRQEEELVKGIPSTPFPCWVHFLDALAEC